ncbi:ribonuclease HI [Blattabacterium cuenoti]|uniref:ribonuclease HI n=1 Tax=Blattabacterium cuenoti TaxID=1653831 RepID=UPI001EEC62BD|nr:ribonuclease H [Blattabacterium cuenoti]
MNKFFVNKRIHIYTDGSSRGNPGPGGYGVFIEIFSYISNFYKQIIISEGFRYTTNNRMELLATIVGLKNIKKKKQDITIFTDSKYIINAVQNSWIYKWEKNNFLKKKNVDLWKKFIQIFHQHFVSFHWIKSHNYHYINDYCDRLSVEVTKKKFLKTDIIYEKQSSL